MRTLEQLQSLAGRTALITGGAGHLGSAIAETFVELGAAVIVLDQDAERAQTVATRITAAHGTAATPLVVNLEDEEALRAVPLQLDRLDILVHCAALVGTTPLPGWNTPFAEQSVDTWRRCLAVNLTAAFTLTQAVAPLLTASGHGSIITIGSIHGLGGPNMSLYAGTAMGNPAAYGVSKAGLLQLTRWLATTLAPKVRANMISLGGVFRQHTDPFHARYCERTPLGRMATEEDVRGAAAFLASDAAAYVTGHNLVVDGGWTAW